MTRRLALVASATLAVLALATSAPAADACWQQLVRDWSADATVDGRYPIPCYRQAIANLPVDLQTYSSAPSDIDAALHARILEAPQTRSSHPATSHDGGSGARTLLVLPAGVLLLAGILGLLRLLRRGGRGPERALDTGRRP